MSTVNTIQGVLNWAAAEILNRPTINVAGTFQEPALTNANLIMSTILSPPFAWQWNRAVATTGATQGQSDYAIQLSDFGWLEKATLTYVSPPVGQAPVVELEISTVITASGKQNRPFKICPVLDDNAGNITFRLFPIPDQSYTLTLTYQKAPISVTNLYGTQIPLTAVAAASGGQTTYTGTIPNPSSLLNQYFQVSGFANNLNNGLFLSTMTNSTTLILQNPNGVAITANGTAALATTWAPIPDKYNFLYERGMLAMLHKIYDQAAYLAEMQMFYRQLVGCSEGLSESARAIFLEDKLSQLRTEAYVQNATTAGIKRAQ